jgi:hypothetical protein
MRELMHVSADPHFSLGAENLDRRLGIILFLSCLSITQSFSPKIFNLGMVSTKALIFHCSHEYSLWHDLPVSTKMFDLVSVVTLVFDLLIENFNLGCIFWMVGTFHGYQKSWPCDLDLCVWPSYCFVCLFIAAWAIFQLSGGCHHYRWQGCKFRPMLGAQGHWKNWSYLCLLNSRYLDFDISLECDKIFSWVPADVTLTSQGHDGFKLF